MAYAKNDSDMPRDKPAPEHPEERTTNLPPTTPKPARDDIDAQALVAEIMRAPNYRTAGNDFEFRNRSDNRGLRRRLDDSKAETLLEEHGVADHRGKRRTLSLQDFNLPKLRYNLSCFSRFPAIADPPIAEQMASSWWTTFRGLLQQNPANDAESDLC